MKVLYLLFFCSLLFSCRKTYQKTISVVNEDPDNLKEQLQGRWRLYAQTSNPENDWNGDGMAETNMFGTYNDCQKTAGFTFKPEGTGVIQDSCADSVNIRWEIMNSSNDFRYSRLSTGLAPHTIVNKIIQLNQRYFIFSGSMQAPNGKTFIVVS